ncbi:folate-binding protein YgfZ, partial [Methylobacterium sp. WL122]
MPIALLPDRALVHVTGPDAPALLQGVITCNVETLGEAEARLGALLTPQGKIQFDFLISPIPGGFRLDIASEQAAALAKRLTLYRLRAQVEIAVDPTVAIAASWDGATTAAEAGRDFPLGDAFPHEALMDQLGGVDFRKGCYVGQEVVSRMQHRGTARTRMLPATYPEGEAAAPGSEITAGAKVLGRT